MTMSRHCERSEAIQTCVSRYEQNRSRQRAVLRDVVILDFFVACAPRNDGLRVHRSL